MSERVVIDKAGRIVIPKSIREAFGFEEGDLLLVEQKNGGLLLLREETEGGLVRRDHHLFKPAVRGARKLTAGDVRNQLESLRMRGALKPKRKSPSRKRSRT